MCSIIAAGQERVIHRPRHLWSAEVIQRFDDRGSGVIIKRAPHRLKNNPLILSLVKYSIKRECRFLKEIGFLGSGIAPRVLSDGKSDVVMEFIEGENLFQCRQKAPNNSKIYYTLKKAVIKLHSLGISHGEIRLGNIIISDKEDVLLVDFALAVRKNNILFKFMATLDLLALNWIKENVFLLELDSEEIMIRKKSPFVAILFDKLIAKDIQFA